MKYLSICLILFLFMSSCKLGKIQSNELIDLSQSINLEGQAINSIDSSCFYDIELVDSMLILLDMCNRNFIYSYNLSTYKPLFSTGIQGKGPNDFVSMPFFSQSDKAKVSMSEPTGQAKHFNQISAPLNAIETVPLGAEFMGSKNIIFSRDTIYGNNTSSGDGIIFYKDNEEINWIKPPNFIKMSSEAGDFKQLLLNNSFVIGGGSDVIAVGMKYYNSIFFLDRDGNLLKFFRLNDNIAEDYIPTVDTDAKNISVNNTVFINDVYATDKYVYFLYYGKSLSDFENKHTGEISQVIVFDWDGNHIKNISTDKKLLFIAATNNDEKLYGGEMTEKEIGSIIQYELN